MSESTANTTEGNKNQPVPRAIVHKQILDTAESRPAAAMEDIASEVTGASIDLVEQVLEEYGDPANNNSPIAGHDETESEQRKNSLQGGTNESTNDSQNDRTEPLDDTPLSEKQRETLRAIRENPDATQRAIADRFDVTPSTISQRVNSISGFTWSNRDSFVKRILPDESTTLMKQEPPTDATEALIDRIDELTEYIQRLETRLDETSTATQSCIEDPELAVKIMHACLHSEQVTEDEEVQILNQILAID